MASLTLDQIRATPLGKTPVIEELIAMIDHIKQNQDDIGALSGGGDPGWNSAIDTRWLISETGGNANNYVAAINNAAGNSLPEGFNYWMINMISNTGACTLDTGTIEGSLPLMKWGVTSLVALEDGDVPLHVCRIYYSSNFNAWVLQNPTGGGITHTTSTVLPNPGDGKDGDIWYVIES